MPSPLRAVWAEPAPPRPPVRRWREVAVVGVVAAVALLEGVLRPELHGRQLFAVGTAVLALTLLWRRTRPLTALLVAFVGITALSLVPDPPEVWSSIFVLGLAYGVVRWGSGRAAVIGGSGLLAYGAIDSVARGLPAGDVIGGLAVLGASLALGTAMRFRARARQRALDEVRLLERERIARDLHDTVAHHVSAIAVRAQAGLAVAPLRPEAATEALAVIEAEASRTLAEMRTIVRVLRRGEPDAAADAPSRGLADVVLL
ncbi:histidine kinase dimerization/phosphoacceptor domain-containing protein, partial [Actinotalea ferrariae]|uniref:histidine kinase dimerization/phosphoacceptor domain-containing protein n=1 Tax=Actinotalea ferrariae TaxID=1386098 RepID=UPI001C8C970D